MATRLSGTDIVFQLLECCDEPLRKDLTRTYSTLTTENEETVLAYIKTLAVRLENIMVARVHLQQLRQDRDEPVRAFCARLRGQAGVCKFKKNCSCAVPKEVDYSDEMIRDAFIRGLEDEDIRLDILGQSRQEMPLEEVLKLAEAKESGKRSAGRLLENSPTVTAAMTSNYRRRNNLQPQQRGIYSHPEDPTTTPCGYCGKLGHEKVYSLQSHLHKVPHSASP